MKTTFETFQLQPFLNNALAKKGFQYPTEVQEEIIPLILQGKNVIVQSQTGSGKTHAFLLPVIEKINLETQQVQGIITAPSRELANQIYQEAKELVADTDIRVSNFVGGTDKQRQIDKLGHQQPHLVIGTPGRILDLMKSGALLAYTTEMFVVDEADMTLDLGFLSVVDQIASNMPEKLQMMVFSATIPEKLRPFFKKYLTNPVIKELKNQTVISPTIDNWLISSKGTDKKQVVYQLLTMGNPYLAIVFANTKQKVDEIEKYLKAQGLKVAKIHGDIPPRERKRTMRQIQNLEYQYIVATDLAARGIDIEGISLVINYELSNDKDFFIHRVGRTGRNQLPGTAITLYSPGDEVTIKEIEDLGVIFEPKAIKAGEIVDSYDRNRRRKRSATKPELDPTIIGMVKKSKKKVKPGYRKKINRAISENAKQKKRAQVKSDLRKQKKERKQSQKGKK